MRSRLAAKLKSIAGISRVPFLLLPVVLVASGAAAAAYDGSFSWPHTLLALFGMFAAHVAVNSLNEASDMQTGIDLETERTPFSGGSGTLPAGELSVRAAYVWSFFMIGVATAVGVYFLVEVGTELLPILVVGLVAIVTYTHVLARLGFGEVLAGLGLGALPVLGAALVQEGTLGQAAVAVSIPAFLMTFNLLLLNEFPDEAADRKGGRRNLVLLFGRRGAARLWALAVLLVPTSIGVGVFKGALPPLALVACAATLLTIPGLRWAFLRPDARVPIPALGRNVAWNLATNALLAGMLALAVALG